MESKMKDKLILEKLASYYQDLVDGEMGEGLLSLIDEILIKNPEAINFFIDKFSVEENKGDKETLAQIILRQKQYQPAIDFLKTEMGWDDFTGFAGFPES